MGSDWRRIQTVTLLAGILVALGSVVWHVHPAAAPDDDGSGTCPICFSQRSLTHCSITAQVVVAAPSETAALPVFRSRPVPTAPSPTLAARAPPSA